MDHIESIGSNIRRARLIRGMSQLELSKRIGLSPGHISEIKNGGRKYIKVKRLARGLETDIATILDEKGSGLCYWYKPTIVPNP